MIAENNTDWRDELADAVTDSDELAALLGLPASMGRDAAGAAGDYPLFVPRSFVRRMVPGDPDDPLLLQVLPRSEEGRRVAGFSADPLDERSVGSSPTVLKKYPGRVLLLPTFRCGIHCRFCFRRCFPKADGNPDFGELLEPLRNASDVEEVILSGGDPLMLDDAALRRLLHYIVKIPNVKRIRLHSRLPIAIPRRVTPELVDLLSGSLPIYLVLHVNHPAELSDSVLSALARISGVPVLSQTVLLKGVNDDFEVLCRLFGCLVNHRIMPYYLHQLDRVSGAAHFEVPCVTGRELMSRLLDRLPGYAVPRYVREVVGKSGKRPI